MKKYVLTIISCLLAFSSCDLLYTGDEDMPGFTPVTLTVTKRESMYLRHSESIANEILMYFRASKKTNQDVYINDAIDTDKDGNSLTLIDIIPDESDVSEEIETKIRIEHLKKIFDKTLTNREKTIINMRYGINGEKEYTQREIAKKLGISRSYVSRIEKSALEKLKDKF